MRSLLTCACFALIIGCGSHKGSAGTGGNGEMGVDMAMAIAHPMRTDMAGSACGWPGDVGNSKGVGKYCMTNMDCAGQAASICSTINNTDMTPPDQITYFCVLPFCVPNDDPDHLKEYCGESAICLQSSLGTACAPAECFPKP